MSGGGDIPQQSQKINDSGIASERAESFSRTPRPGFCPSYDFKTQCRLAWANVEEQLKAANMTLADIVKFTIFLADRAYRQEEWEVRKEVLASRKQPAMTIIITGIYDEAWLLEIEAIAAA